MSGERAREIMKNCYREKPWTGVPVQYGIYEQGLAYEILEKDEGLYEINFALYEEGTGCAELDPTRTVRGSWVDIMYEVL